MALVIRRAKAPVPPPAPVEPVTVQSTATATRYLDDLFDKTYGGNRPNLLVSWYLIAAYTYYHHDEPVLTDGKFDALAKELIAKYDEIEHDHKHLITLDDLKAGTLLLASEQYPNRTKSAARHLLQHHRGVTITITET